MHLTSLFITTLFALSSLSAAQQLPGAWPALDVPPPAKAEWTALVDQSKLPNAPVQKKGGPCKTPDTYCAWTCTSCVRPTDISFCPTQKDWGITYDDGPSPYTPALLDYLDKINTKATFFIVGSRVVENPATLKRAYAAGHQIGVHTWSHPYLTTQSTEQIIAEIKWTEQAIKTAIGVTPVYARPPYGDTDDRVRAIFTQLGYKTVLWDLDSTDYQSDNNPKYDPATITNLFTQWVGQSSANGHISLEHDLYSVAAQNAPKALDIVKGAGFAVKPVSVCTGSKAYLEGDLPGANATTPANTTTIASTSTSTTTSSTPTITSTSTTAAPTTTPTPASTDSLSSSSILFPSFVSSWLALTFVSIVFLFNNIDTLY